MCVANRGDGPEDGRVRLLLLVRNEKRPREGGEFRLLPCQNRERESGSSGFVRAEKRRREGGLPPLLLVRTENWVERAESASWLGPKKGETEGRSRRCVYGGLLQPSLSVEACPSE
ncbi:hypothetical protein MA16_Dca011231 [Dendrobium catenatum]|uniref:Uncharacterized protein n=1 Tax=Dendrobium catenatum TaxID=906689 RepID=A0A2I0VW66_9ASPA|nr:hypothetical protein MA16_Dca011231 [Dendrobium catenatum]